MEAFQIILVLDDCIFSPLLWEYYLIMISSIFFFLFSYLHNSKIKNSFDNV